ncbi:MAG: phosphoribosylformylglycinamidine cyclo-ligase [Chitinispirillaceae bacterium]|nr:phosphoribosylformylglycinamidine cyclo-ligase [Chitinispirillaceae bacterium]
MAKSLKYADAGVDISVWNKSKGRIGEMVRSTYTGEVVGGFGSFGGMFSAASLKNMTDPVLVSSTDSVGTKVKVAFETGIHNTVGEDIVNHCINDILVLGARPLFFLDYIGINKLLPEVTEQLLEGLSRACTEAGCVLIGGETAEMPDVYSKGEYDLVGCIVGVVEKGGIIDGSSIIPGDICIGLRSSGLHTNGYSLARKIVKEVAGRTYRDPFENSPKTFGEVLLAPHRSYRPVRGLMERRLIKGCAHITGGGFQDNINRVLPAGCDAVITTTAWTPDPIFRFLMKVGNVAADEMYHTFNMGIGMVLVAALDKADSVLNAPEIAAFEPKRIGRIVAGTGEVRMEY